MASLLRTRTSTLIKFTERLIQNLPLNPAQMRRQQRFCASKVGGGGGKKSPAKIYNTPHPPKDPPESYQPSVLSHIAFEAPDFLPCAIFRPFAKCDEQLGPGATKDGPYKNPEYFAYHRYSFVDTQLNVMQLRHERLCNDNARCVYEAESDDEDEVCGGAGGDDDEEYIRVKPTDDIVKPSKPTEKKKKK